MNDGPPSRAGSGQDEGPACLRRFRWLRFSDHVNTALMARVPETKEPTVYVKALQIQAAYAAREIATAAKADAQAAEGRMDQGK